MNQSKDIKIGMISFAHMHAASYANSLQRHPDASIAWIYDVDTERAIKTAAQYDAPVLYSLDDISSTECHGIIICSENIHHLKYTEIAAKAGKPILCEKPLATNPANAQAMLDICEENKVPLMTAFPCRFHPAYIKLRTLHQEGLLGDILAIKATNQGVCPWGWFVNKELSGGGSVTDHTVHVLDLIRDLTGQEVSAVYAEISNKMFKSDFEDTGIINIELTDGTFATIDCSWSRPKSNPIWGNVKLEVICTKGVCAIDLMNQKSEVFSDLETGHSYQYWGDDMDFEMICSFVERCKSGEQFLVTGLDGAKTVEVVAAAYRSVETEAVVRI